MRALHEEICHSLLADDSETGFFMGLVLMANRLDFDYCAYVTRMPRPASDPELFACDNYPSVWQSRYREKGYQAVDPTLHKAMQSPSPMLWTEKTFASAREMRRDAKACGLNHGWAKSCRDIHGAVGVLTLARTFDAIKAPELREKTPMMIWLAQAAHIGLSRHLSGLQSEALRERKLSPRELEILRWSAEGKTAGEIATILDIAERTVVFHLNSVIGKLDATNKTQAVARAVSLGLIY